MSAIATTVTIALILVIGATAIAGILAGTWFIARAAWKAVLNG